MNWSQIKRQWFFYLNHSLRDLIRNGSRTAFAVFCIATGVAAVVALRSLALMIADELTTNLAEINRGDIQIVPTDDLDPDYVATNTQNEDVFSQRGMMAMMDWAEDEGIIIQFASNTSFSQMLPLQDDGTYGTPFSVVALLVQPETYPYYSIVYSVAPDRRPLSEILNTDERVIMLSQRAARDHGLQIGDQVRIGGQVEPFTIIALADDSLEGSTLARNGPAGLLGFFYYPLEKAEDVGLSPLPDTAYVQLPLGRDVESVSKSLQERFGDEISHTTTEELADQNEETADLINDLILVMGLSSVLIGGIGIINTMLVIVGRRTLEIAVLKTLGLKAWRVTVLFLVEAALMGIIGSLLGIPLGTALSYVVRGVGEDVLRTDLSWRAYPEAWFSGLTLGFIVTVAFGFLPTLIAGQVRPAGVLRPNEIKLPSAGLQRMLVALWVIIIMFGLTLNIIVAGRLTLPPTLMIGLGFTIIGLFSGVMIANRGVLDPIPSDAHPETIQRGLTVFSVSLAGLLMVFIFAADLILTPLHKIVIYGLPTLIGISLFYGLRQFAQNSLTIRAAHAARQVLLAGGAIILGLLVGGGLFILATSVIGVLYPDQDRNQEFMIAAVLCGAVGILSMVGFRLRGQRAAALVGMALMGGAVMGVAGFGIGELLRSLLEDTFIWDALESFSVGIAVVEITTLALGAAFVVLWGVVWLIGRIPPFGNVDIKLALRNISNRRNRTASTMLGLIAGIAALALITLTTSAVTSLLEQQIETDAGGNVFILSSDNASRIAVQKRLENRIEGVKSYSQFTVYRGRIVAVDGEAPDLEGMEFGDAADGNRNEFGQVEGEPGIGWSFSAIDLTTDLPDFKMKAGRYFRPEDEGELVMVIRDPFPGSLFDRMGLKVGGTMTWLLRPPTGSDAEPIEVTYTIIGIIDRNSEQSIGDQIQAPVTSVPSEISPEVIVTIADIEDEHIDQAMIEFAQIANVTALDIRFIVQLIQRLLDQLIAIPTLVAVLALFAGIAIIANTVALDTQERRRQIGILKAVGLKGYRVLFQMIFENALIGLVSGLIGVGIGLLATILIGVLGEAEQISQTLSLRPALGLIALAILVSVLATLISAWTAARESPLNVLRYE